MTLRILVDADACPVKEEATRVALRHAVPITFVSNSPFRIAPHPLVTRVVVGSGFDEADAATIVVTGDIPLADRALKAGAAVLAHNGRPFTAASIGAALATRAIMADLRAGVETDSGGGPAPFSKPDRSHFLGALDEALVRLKRRG